MTKTKRQMEDMADDDTRDTNAAQPLSAETQELISKKLRQVYGKILAEPMPKKFSALLEELAKTEAKK